MKKFAGVFLILLSPLILISCQESKYSIPDSCDIYDISNEVGVILGYINGFAIKRSEISCDWVVGEIVVDGYDFGFFYWGCSKDLDGIGYYAEKDDEHFYLQDLVDEEEVTTEQIYHLYMCDPYRVGVIE